MSLVNERARILANNEVGPRLYVMTLEAPRIARAALPGQFIHMKIPQMDDHILRRPFGIYAHDKVAGTIDALYQVVGYGTRHLSELEVGLEAEVIGPVGHGWNVPHGARRVLVVGGGVGAAPLFLLCEQLHAENACVDVVLGAQTASTLVCRERFEAALGEVAGAAVGESHVLCATDDGSFGRAGFCTSLVGEALEAANAAGQPYDYVAVCGPEPLMRIVANQAAEAGVFCEVSLEKRMACGIGACLSCVVDTREGKKRACVDGPVFKAEDVVW